MIRQYFTQVLLLLCHSTMPVPRYQVPGTRYQYKKHLYLDTCKYIDLQISSTPIKLPSHILLLNKSLVLKSLLYSNDIETGDACDACDACDAFLSRIGVLVHHLSLEIQLVLSAVSKITQSNQYDTM